MRARISGRWAATAVVAAAAVIGAAAVAGQAAEPAPARESAQVTATPQLLTSIRRDATRALTATRPLRNGGWRSSHIADGTIRRRDLSPALQDAVGPQLLWAAVSADGRLDGGLGVVSATRRSLGTYSVAFTDQFAGCPSFAQLFDTPPQGTLFGSALTALDLEDPSGSSLLVQTADSTGTLADRDFMVMIPFPCRS